MRYHQIKFILNFLSEIDVWNLYRSLQRLHKYVLITCNQFQIKIFLKIGLCASEYFNL